MFSREEFSKILFLYLLWYLVIYVILYFSAPIVPLKIGFLGGSLTQYLHSADLWAFINFDGKHYLSIARYGYKDLQHFFFPLYVLLISAVSQILFIKKAVSGLIVSRFLFFIALLGFYKLVRLDNSRKIGLRALLILMIFPTSFYFASYYTESLFLLLTVWSFYFARKKRWLTAGILGALSTATRIIGLALIPALIVELYLQWKKLGDPQKRKAILSILIIPVGIILYMYYLWVNTGDPLVFYNKVHIFGQQRSTGFILLPQVFYRYFFKILPAINYDYFPLVFVTLTETAVAVIFTILAIYAMVKIRASYVIYFLVALLIPTFSGSFSSLPRYVLVIFPAFLLASIILDKISKAWRYIFYVFLFILLIISASLFFRGYWIA